ncbi:choice-of-anchor D domain-containing protein [Kribbella albertanoniae]|uniref:Choice-of-anchor D domain-containing protein n=1 Tax=Kribbella albertanoniae TaxID=1266829 RepID=A0A4R4QFA8_9ACTN|nr:choice-of-anchor D domain-containing protein [Kribbella albertanoniae]TDC34311.1 choice-of-anchor D domain-containing protein [Kribbella albertanoniae]
MSRIPRVPTAIITAAALLAAGLAVLISGRGASAAEGDPPIIHPVSHPPSQGASYRSSVSSDGRWVAFESEAQETEGIWLRDLREPERSVRLPGLDHLTALMPTMSGDAGLIAFAGGRFGGGVSNQLHDAQLYVVNRRDPESTVLKQVTGAPNDLPYQRLANCRIESDGENDRDCEPKLSRDGTTLVAPVLQSVQSGDLEMTIDGSDASTDRGLYPVLDFWAFNTSGQKTVTLKNVGGQPMIYPDTGPVLDGDPQFTVAASTCAGVLRPNTSCSVTVSYTGNDCTYESNGVLRFPAASAAGQTAIKLTAGGECPRLAAFPPQAAAGGANCSGPSEYKGFLPAGEEPHAADNGHPHPWFPLGFVNAGLLNITSATIRNAMSVPLIPTLSSPGCQMKLVLPPDAAPDACQPGQPVAPQASCTAYVEYAFPEVGPFSGSIHLGDTVYRIGGHAGRKVIAAWRDAGASGSFGPGRVVSVTGGANGVPMDGTGPTVSADGRWVGFMSKDPFGRPADVPSGFQQVYLHDTDTAGDRSYRPGETTLVSLKATGRPMSEASEPSVSDDGTRIAFRGATGDDISDQVWVRDVPAKKTVLGSANTNGQTSFDGGHRPELSGDGHTLVYLSDGDDLGPGTLAGDRVIARDLTKDFSGGRGVNELISPRSSGPGTATSDGYPAVSQNGTLTTFASKDPVDEWGDADEESDVFYSQRRSYATGTPDPVDLGTAKVGTSAGPVPFTVTNTGSVPIKFRAPKFHNPEFGAASNQCVEVTIRPGQSCAFLIKFTPRAIGVRKGTIDLFDVSGGVGPWIITDLTGRGSSDARMPGETKHVSTNRLEHLDPAVSDSGQFVAYRSRISTGDQPFTEISVRDQAGAGIRTVGDHDTVGPPRISADGTRVVYEARDDSTEKTFVAHAAGEQQVTGTASDLRYQRPCDMGTLSRECRPDISGDGKTVAFAARLDPLADYDISLKLQEPDDSLHDVRGLIDLGGGGLKQLQVTPREAIHFGGKASIDTGSGFWVDETTCDGDLAADATCTVDIRYDACAGPGYGVLRLNGSIPSGQAAIALVANGTCIRIRNEPAVRAAADCTPLPAPDYYPAPSTTTTSAGNTVADAGQTTVGTVKYVAATVPAQPNIQDLSFASGCDFALVTPTGPAPDRPRPCVAGERLPEGTGCTAYVAYRPSSVDAAAASLNIRASGSKPVRFAGAGIQNVVLTRTDTAGDGTFAGAPEIVSKDSNGAVVVGVQPSLSADGRYVAYVGAHGIDQPEQATLQVYRRDRTTGTTELVSKLADGNIGTDDAQYPSLSASGQRVAFETEGISDPEGSARKTKAARAEGPPHPSRIWVRDLSTAKSVLASAAAGKAGEDSDGWSHEPSLSDDGTTVGFASTATDLVEQPGNDQQGIYVRYLDPDFAGAAASERFTERVSLNEEGAVVEDGDSRSPSLSGDGAFTAFESTSDLVAGTVDDGLWDVFTRRRVAQLVATPASADFGAVQVGKSSSAREMVVKNVGYGPAAAGPAVASAPFIAGSNVCTQTLHRGQSCTIDARFAPTAAGPATGTLTLPSKSGYLAGPSAAVGLTGTSTPVPPVARFGVTPAALTFPAVEVGKASSPQPVKLQNTGDVPLNIAAKVNGTGDFDIKPGTCTTVMPGATCDVPVTFAPRATGNRTGGIVFTPTSADPAVKSPAAVTVGLTGSGTPGAAVASMTVAPQALVFGPQILTVPSAPKSIVVTNTGTVPLRLTGVSSVADFKPAVGCALLQPGKTCAIAVQFVPQLLGARTGVVQVAATATGAVAPFPVPVKVSGTTLAPTLLVEPPVARPGQIVIATGTNFPPGRTAVLGWDVGLGGQPAVADKTGKFVAPVLVYRRDVLGQRVMTATVPGLVSSSGRPLPVKSQPVLVMPLSYQPPNFVLRW